MTHTPAPLQPDRLARRQSLLRLGWRVLGILAVILLVATGTWAVLQTQRIDNLHAAIANARADAATAAKTAAAEYDAEAGQYALLFSACQKSVECLASAPPEQAPVIIQGTQGLPGKSVTPAEAEAALADYCSAHNACIGTTGAAGAPGQNGSDGANGINGINGANGVSVTNVTCVSTGTFTTALEFSFSDGNTIDVSASCNT